MNISMTLSELREIAKELNLKGYSKLNKEELFNLIMKNSNPKNMTKNEFHKAFEESNEITKQYNCKDYEDFEADLKELEETNTKRISKEEREEEIGKDYEFKQGQILFDENDKVYFNDKTLRTIVIRGDGKKYILDHNTFVVKGYLDMVPDGYGFLRNSTLKRTSTDIYVSANMIKNFNLRTGDYVIGIARSDSNSKFPPLLFITDLNYTSIDNIKSMPRFESLVPTYPNKRLRLENDGETSNRLISLFSPIGLGQRSLIVAPPKAGKTTILKTLAKGILASGMDVELMILLIDERPEEVTDISDSVNTQVIASTFDEKPEEHIHIAEFALEIAKRKVEAGKDVVLLLDSITRLARAYNLVVPSSGKVLSGGFDPNALYKPKNFFGSARNTREAGSLTVIATALIETGSRLDDVIYEEFKGTGNMELQLERSLAESRIFPAINIRKSGTRKDEYLYTNFEKDTVDNLRVFMNNKTDIDFLQKVLTMINKTATNDELLRKASKHLD